MKQAFEQSLIRLAFTVRRYDFGLRCFATLSMTVVGGTNLTSMTEVGVRCHPEGRMTEGSYALVFVAAVKENITEDLDKYLLSKGNLSRNGE